MFCTECVSSVKIGHIFSFVIFIINKETKIVFMLNRLIASFIAATQDKTTKRGVEWIMADFIYCIYILIMLGAMVAFISFNAWYAMLFVAVSFMLLMSGWGWLSYHLRKTLLTLLYPPTEHTDENGDNTEETLDRLNEMLQTFAKEVNVNLEELK